MVLGAAANPPTGRRDIRDRAGSTKAIDESRILSNVIISHEARRRIVLSCWDWRKGGRRPSHERFDVLVSNQRTVWCRLGAGRAGHPDRVVIGTRAFRRAYPTAGQVGASRSGARSLAQRGP